MIAKGALVSLWLGSVDPARPSSLSGSVSSTLWASPRSSAYTASSPGVVGMPVSLECVFAKLLSTLPSSACVTTGGVPCDRSDILDVSPLLLAPSSFPALATTLEPVRFAGTCCSLCRMRTWSTCRWSR